MDEERRFQSVNLESGCCGANVERIMKLGLKDRYQCKSCGSVKHNAVLIQPGGEKTMLEGQVCK